MTSQVQQEALDRALQSASMSNYPAIFVGFMAKGIPEADIKPRENVFSFHAWKALGRSVRKGEHGVKIATVRKGERTERADDGTETKVAFSSPWFVTVFHVSQTDAIAGQRPYIPDVAANAVKAAESAGQTRPPKVDYYSDEFTRTE